MERSHKPFIPSTTTFRILMFYTSVLPQQKKKIMSRNFISVVLVSVKKELSRWCCRTFGVSVGDLTCEHFGGIQIKILNPVLDRKNYDP
jgi:hypothetical protein